MTQGTGKVKLFGGMVHDVIVPKDIVFMGDSVGPVTREVKGKKGEHIHQPGCLNLEKPKLSIEPLVGYHCHTESQNVFGDIGNPRTQASHHVRHRHGISAFKQAPGFF